MEKLGYILLQQMVTLIANNDNKNDGYQLYTMLDIGPDYKNRNRIRSDSRFHVPVEVQVPKIENRNLKSRWRHYDHKAYIF